MDRTIYTVESVNKDYLNDTIGKLEEQVNREVRAGILKEDEREFILTCALLRLKGNMMMKIQKSFYGSSFFWENLRLRANIRLFYVEKIIGIVGEKKFSKNFARIWN